MKPESIVLTVAGMCFGIIVGWILANLEVNRAPVVTQPQAQAATTDERKPPVLDEARVTALTTILTHDPSNAGAAAQLGGVYFDAERFEEAVKWYLEALRLDPKNVDASTQLGMAYFFTKGPDAALEQFDLSLKIDPKHARTLLNKGIVLWRGKQDVKGAEGVWLKLVEVAPNSPEAQAAKQGLQGIAAAAGEGQPPPTSNQ